MLQSENYELGDRIKGLRAGLNLTQEQLAKKANISVHTLRSIEQNKANYHPSADVLCGVAKALGLPESEFLATSVASIPGPSEPNVPGSRRWLLHGRLDPRGQRVLLVFIAGAMIVVSLLVLSRHLARPRILGPLDFDLACERQFQSEVVGRRGYPLNPKDVYSWKCEIPAARMGDILIPIGDIDTNTACREQYNSAAAKSNYHDVDDAYSWYCYLR